MEGGSDGGGSDGRGVMEGGSDERGRGSDGGVGVMKEGRVMEGGDGRKSMGGKE